MECVRCGSTAMVEGSLMEMSGGGGVSFLSADNPLWKRIFGGGSRKVMAHACVHCSHLELTIEFTDKDRKRYQEFDGPQAWCTRTYQLMKLSVVIPAYNEEKYLPATLEALKLSLGNFSDIEIIVIDDESTDSTPQIAASFGARVINSAAHNIGKVRNIGAAAADGEALVFLDADTLVRPGAFERILAEMSDEKCLGGSVAVEYERPRNRPWMRFFMWLWTVLGRLTKMRQGAIQFCRRDVFEELGGYDPTIFVGEDIEFHWRMDKLAKQRGGHTVYILEPSVETSSRRWEKMGLMRMLFFTHPVTMYLASRRPAFWKDWYEKAIR